MQPSAHLQAAIDILEHLEALWASDRRAPIDSQMGKYFKERRYIGSKDRGVISDLVYFVLRNGAALQWHIEQCNRQATPRRVMMVALMFYAFAGKPMRTRYEIAELFNGQKFAPPPISDQDRVMLERMEGKGFLDAAMPPSVLYNYPEWMESRLQEAFGKDLPIAMLALNGQAPIDLRANLLKCKGRDALLATLEAEGYVGAPTPHSPLGVRLTKRLSAFNTQAFKDGMYEMQDEGSQIASLLVEAKAGQKVVDFCAGAGGKTLAIAATMQNKGRILAWDVAEHRLEQIHKRLARSGVSNVQTHVLKSESDPFLKRHVGSADWVVVDAPCSGSGTWRRNPDLKWRFTLADLEEVKALQASILPQAARLVKRGGKLVYLTCSIFPEENIMQVKQFLEAHPTFRVAPLPKMWNNHALTVEGLGSFLALTPHKDGTDGFFGAVLTHEAAA